MQILQGIQHGHAVVFLCHVMEECGQLLSVLAFVVGFQCPRCLLQDDIGQFLILCKRTLQHGGVCLVPFPDGFFHLGELLTDAVGGGSGIIGGSETERILPSG